MTTTERLRADIDGGRTGDKVAGSDPAAAPLGTDDEAAGTAPRPEDVAMARRHELKHEGQPSDDKSGSSVLLYMIILSAVMLILTGALLYFIGVR
jgi:hypothetical protein